MTAAEITATRLQALSIIAAVIDTCDQLRDLDSTLANPTDIPKFDAEMIDSLLEGAAASAERVASMADKFAHALDQHHQALQPKQSEVRR